jgi:hypothetical protein
MACHERRRRTIRGLAVAGAALAILAASCSLRGRPLAPSGGLFIEEFEGFPIYHGDPGRPYRVLGRVHQPEAAARGVTPMKRAAVAEARRLGADAIVIGVLRPGPRGGGTASRETPAPDASAVTGPAAKWEHAVAVTWK